MKRLPIWIVAVLAIAGCNKPSEGDCRKAIANMQHLMGTEHLRDDPAGTAALEGEVRRCKGGSKKKAVKCAMDAKTIEDLQKCEFYHVPANAKGVGTVEPAGSAGSAGSAVGSAGSAAEVGSGSAGAAMGGAGAVGSDGAGSAGSAAPAAGSAGSAGSAAPAAGSAK